MTMLFEPTRINGMELKNRFFRSATWTGMATEDGFMTDKLKNLILDVAKGGVAVIVPDYMSVSRSGISADRQLGIYDDKHIPGLREMVNSIHRSGSKVIAQIVHGGAHTREDLTGEKPKGPSAIAKTEGPAGEFPGCETMSQQDITDIIESFCQAAMRCKQAGFDGIQLHCAHGYLFSQFLSPFYNKRTDIYGGNVAGRAHIVLEAYKKIRKEVGDNYPIMVKLNVTDFLDDGITDSDALQITGILSDAGVDAIELSGGTGWGLRVLGDMNLTPMRTVKEEGYYRDTARLLKVNLNVRIILTGGIRSYQAADEFLQDNTADYIGLCRPLIYDPSLINRWESGDTEESGCISCNGCGFAAAGGKDLVCVQKNKR